MSKDSTVRLISAEGFEFVIDYEAACVSNTIKNMLTSQGESSQQHCGNHLVRLCFSPLSSSTFSSTRLLFSLSLSLSLSLTLFLFSSSHANPGSFTESELGEIRFPEISTPILEKVCQYFYYKLRYTNRYEGLYSSSSSSMFSCFC